MGENKNKDKDSDHVVIKFKRVDLAEDESDLEIVRLIEGGTDPSFELPAFLKWPKGDRRNGERALLLMRAGLEHLRERYPPKRRQGAQGNATSEAVKAGERSSASEPDTSVTLKGW